MPVVESGRAIVALDERFSPFDQELQRELGPGYLVISGSVSDVPDAVLVLAVVAVISAARIAYPDSFVLALSAWSGGAISEYVDARADQVVGECVTVELAARVEAGLRRRGWQRVQGAR